MKRRKFKVVFSGYNGMLCQKTFSYAEDKCFRLFRERNPELANFRLDTHNPSESNTRLGLAVKSKYYNFVHNFEKEFPELFLD